jgi:hypothetical protein
MSRRASFAVLAGSAALVVGCALFLLVGIAAGVWQPRGGSPSRDAAETPTPGGIQLGARSYEQFLDDVREGAVVSASQQGDLVQVEAVFGAYTVTAPAGVDVYGDMQGAAETGGVEVPSYNGEGLPPKTISYAEFLGQVERGRIFDVTQQGLEIHATAETREYLVTVPSRGTDVLGDIEAAAERGGVQPPYYGKAPPG